MKTLNVLAKEKITVPFTKRNNVLLGALDLINVPWFIYDDSTKKVIERSNCNERVIEHAKQNTLIATTHTTAYHIVLVWWAGRKVIGAYSNPTAAYRALYTRSRCYQGNGSMFVEPFNKKEEHEITAEILEQIANHDDGYIVPELKWQE